MVIDRMVVATVSRLWPRLSACSARAARSCSNLVTGSVQFRFCSFILFCPVVILYTFCHDPGPALFGKSSHHLFSFLIPTVAVRARVLVGSLTATGAPKPLAPWPFASPIRNVGT
jgi:hypothetical protein